MLLPLSYFTGSSQEKEIPVLKTTKNSQTDTRLELLEKISALHSMSIIWNEFWQI